MDKMTELMGDSLIPQMVKQFGLGDLMLSNVTTRNAVYEIVGAAPYELTVSDIALKVHEEFEISSPTDVRSFIAQEIARNRLRRDADGRIGFGKTAQIED